MASGAVPRTKQSIVHALERIGIAPAMIDLRDRARYLGDRDTRRRNAEFEAPDGLPLPPPRLIHKVVGHFDERVFYEGGVTRLAYIRDLLRSAGVELESLDDVLDWGCGCGRVLRQWRSVDGVSVSGSDYNRDLVAWCSNNLPFARIEGNGLAPPLAFADDSFDFLYNISVFTHLDEPMQTPWIDELERVVRPGGLILLTVNGGQGGVDPPLDPAERARLEAGDLVVRGGQFEGKNYCAVIHPEEYVRKVLAKRLEVVHARPATDPEVDHGQDAYLLRVPAS